MNKAGRGWSHASRMKPAAEYDIRYGSGLLKKESAGWQPYLMVSTPTAYGTAKPYLSKPPTGIAHAMWLDSKHQKEVSESLPNDAELVVGLGGGRALDVSKFVALDKDLPLIMVPTIVSTGAIIHGVVARWEGRKIVGSIDDWPWVDCNHILVDNDLILEAPYYLNTAGLGDILCGYAAPAEWRWRSKNGIGPPCDETAIAAVLNHHEEITQGFEATLDKQGNLTGNSVRHIMKSVQERDSRWIQRPEAESGDHPFWLALEEKHNTSYIHGEVVAFAAIIIAWLCAEQPELLTNQLDRCKVRRRPREIGISREALREGLEFAPRYMEQKGTNTILRHQPITGAQFNRLWEFLETS